MSCVETTEPINLPFGFVDLDGPKQAQVQSYLQGGAIVHSFNRIYQVAPMYTTCCRELCTKRLNRSIYRLGCGLGWAEGSTSSVIFARWRRCPHNGKTHWHHLANTTEPSVYVAAIWSCQITLTTCLLLLGRIARRCGLLLPTE